MSNIIILTNTAQYSYHEAISNMIYQTLSNKKHTISILDINSCQYDHQCLAKITQLQPDIIITLDLAGFRFRTQSGESALNMLYSKNLNLIWGNKPEYAPYLNKKISLSMLFYDVSGMDNCLPTIYPNLLYYKTGDAYKISTKGLSSSDSNNYKNIWEDFLKETLIYWP